MIWSLFFQIYGQFLDRQWARKILGMMGQSLSNGKFLPETQFPSNSEPFSINYYVPANEPLVMPKYVMWGSYCNNALEKRTPYRQAHLEGLAQQKTQGLLITLGPTKDNTKVLGLYEAEGEATVRKLVENDPYWKHGIWTEYEVKEWIQAF